MTFLHEKEYYAYWMRLIELERQEEMKFHKKEIERLKGIEREKKGRAIVGLRYSKMTRDNLGKYYVYLRRDKEIRNTEIKAGDVVLVSHKDPLKEPSLTATVYYVGKNYVILFFEKKPSSKFFKRTLRIDLYVNETTYARMKEALLKVKKKDISYPLDVLLGHREPLKLKTQQTIKSFPFFNKNLNEVQKRAVIKAVREEKELFLIHGPPGTGKTTTLVEIALQLAERGNKVLISADSNTAVDNFLEKLLQYRQDGVVRVGNITRIFDNLLPYSLDYQVNELLNNIKELKELYSKADKLELQLSKYVKPTPGNRRGLSLEEIVELSKRGKGIRGISSKKMKKMAKYIELNKELSAVKNKINEYKNKALREVLDRSHIVFSTNSTAGSDILKDEDFDVVIIDEATQATEPSSLIPLIKAKKAILAGDHKQLPPTILSMKAKEEGLEVSLFERMIELYKTHAIMLKIQYRMHEEIMKFSNKYFYGGELIAHPITSYELKEMPVMFIDVDGEEEQKKGSTSYFNREEAEKVKELVEYFLNLGFDEKDVGVITPYEDQVELIKNMLKDHPGVEVSTVDGFQGREKEVIILSLVRANKKGNIGFLKDLRRLNVSLTRAKKHLVIIGNKKTLRGYHPLYNEITASDDKK